MKRLAKQILANLYYHGYYKYNKKAGNRVLLYHALGSKLAHDTYGISISPKDFEEHIKFIKDNYEVISLKEDNYVNTLNRNTVSVSFDDGYEDNLLGADILTRHNLPFVIFITTDFIGKNLYLSKKQIKELANNKLCRIGAHGKTHKRLGDLSEKEQYKEILNSKNALEDILGFNINQMSYPHGSCTQKTKDIARECGYKLVGSSDVGVNNIENLDEYSLKRMEVTNGDDVYILRKKIKGYYDYMKFNTLLYQ